MLTLFDFGNSVCCQKVRITMRAKGLSWEPVKVDLFKTEQYDPKYLKLNPKGGGTDVSSQRQVDNRLRSRPAKSARPELGL